MNEAIRLNLLKAACIEEAIAVTLRKSQWGWGSLSESDTNPLAKRGGYKDYEAGEVIQLSEKSRDSGLRAHAPTTHRPSSGAVY